MLPKPNTGNPGIKNIDHKTRTTAWNNKCIIPSKYYCTDDVTLDHSEYRNHVQFHNPTSGIELDPCEDKIIIDVLVRNFIKFKVHEMRCSAGLTAYYSMGFANTIYLRRLIPLIRLRCGPAAARLLGFVCVRCQEEVITSG